MELREESGGVKCRIRSGIRCMGEERDKGQDEGEDKREGEGGGEGECKGNGSGKRKRKQRGGGKTETRDRGKDGEALGRRDLMIGLLAV